MENLFCIPASIQKISVHGAIATLSAVLSLLAPITVPLGQAALQDSPKAVLDEAWQLVNREYVDATFNQNDWQEIRQDLLGQEYSSLDDAYVALEEALNLLDDPYTRFMTPSEFNELTSHTSGEFSGVGLRLKVDNTTQNLIVVDPLENSPAANAGLQSGDVILAIGDQPTEGMTVQDAAHLIRGESGTAVTLRVSRGTSPEFDVSLIRERLEIPAVFSSLRTEFDTKIGFIRLTEFSAHSAEQMQHVVLELLDQGAEAFVLDLRGNPGGLLQASIDISRLWMSDGSIVQTLDRDGHSEEVAADHTALTDKPLAVLVDGNSASSSEILTGALMDNHRATVIGSQTFGKALVQAVHGLSDGSGIAVTVAQYYTPNGTDISQQGIVPDIEIDLTIDQRRRLVAQPDMRGTLADPHYQQAVSSLRPSILVRRSDLDLGSTLR
ncbi:MAG: S41 family peptidase [Cyanobacteria bacterium P01_E01_bin.6]